MAMAGSCLPDSAADLDARIEAALDLDGDDAELALAGAVDFSQDDMAALDAEFDELMND